MERQTQGRAIAYVYGRSITIEVSRASAYTQYPQMKKSEPATVPLPVAGKTLAIGRLSPDGLSLCSLSL